ncbi:ADP-ribosylation factor [Lentinula aciculospora]|uniref:ADP-ribosylation factor n=1 Tax=Lentinula aciculospora TaxID=153920 RepID=A0A9W9AWQ5_9AGAR|nr:ADP-ribosylation factor [Lentinula aciculospora]
MATVSAAIPDTNFSAMFSQLVDRFHPQKYRRRIGLSGLDSCGKTTMIHKLKYGEIIQTIPTIGLVFTTANLNLPTSNGILRCTVWETGAPGCSPKSLRNTVKSVLTPSAAIVWLVDGCDRERLSESVEELQGVVATEVANVLPFTSPILILATKQDLPNVIPLDQLRHKFHASVSGCKAAVFGVSLVKDEESDGLLVAFNWLQVALQNAPLEEPARSPLASSESAAESLEQKLSSWISRAQTDSSREEFLSQFQSINLPSWDHYTHIRLAYVILTTFGRQDGKDMIFDGIEKYIRQSSQTRGRTFHVTMTYFWIQLVHFGICNMQSSVPLDASVSETRTKEDYESSDVKSRHSTRSSAASGSTLVDGFDSTSTSVTVALTPQNGFVQFLLLNPFVTQGNLWEEYYSREVIMTPEAKQGMVLPDKQPLPNLMFHKET